MRTQARLINPSSCTGAFAPPSPRLRCLYPPLSSAGPGRGPGGTEVAVGGSLAVEPLQRLQARQLLPCDRIENPVINSCGNAVAQSTRACARRACVPARLSGAEAIAIGRHHRGFVSGTQPPDRVSHSPVSAATCEMDVQACVRPLYSVFPAELTGHADGTDRWHVDGSGRPACPTAIPIVRSCIELSSLYWVTEDTNQIIRTRSH